MRKVLSRYFLEGIRKPDRLDKICITMLVVLLVTTSHFMVLLISDSLDFSVRVVASVWVLCLLLAVVANWRKLPLFVKED